MNVKDFFKKAKDYIYASNLCKKYKKIALKIKKAIDDNCETLQHKQSNTIFVCWFQGLESAPDIVKICYKSLQKYHQDKDIVIITEDNYSQYVSFPQFIIDRYNDGSIKKTHFSDLLRLELLIKYGGCWVDSTAYFTARIPDYILNSNLFLFQSFREHDGRTSSISNWFINSCSNNKMLLLERDLLYYYWKNNNKLRNYFIFHKFFEKIVIELYSDEWKKVLISDNSSPKILDCYLFDKFNQEWYDIIADKSFIHKFMYKYPKEKFDMEGTLYDKLKQEYLEAING